MPRIVDIDETMYNCGVEVLHPGGVHKTEEMARLCQIGPGKTLLDVGAGRGASACHLAAQYAARVIGIDPSARMVRACRQRAASQGLDDRAGFLVANAYALPFDSDCFDIVIAECVTTLLDKERAFREMARVTRPGGYVGDLEMTWRKSPPQQAVDETYGLWEGYRTMTLAEWKSLLEQSGLEDVKAADFSDAIASLQHDIARELGLGGMLKMAGRLAWRGDLRKAMRAYRRVFQEYADYIGCGYFVGRKPGPA